MEGVARHPNRALLPIYRRLPPEFERFRLRGTWLLSTPVERVLSGFLFECLGGDLATRRLTCFVDPLYDASTFISLGWGEGIPRPKIGGAESPLVVVDTAEGVDETVRVLTEQGLPMLKDRTSLEGFYRHACKREWFHMSHLYAFEALAYTAILLDRIDDARQHFREALTMADITYPLERRRPWEQDAVTRLQRIRDLLIEQGPAAAIEQLDAWQARTTEALNISDLVAPGFPGYKSAS